MTDHVPLDLDDQPTVSWFDLLESVLDLHGVHKIAALRAYVNGNGVRGREIDLDLLAKQLDVSNAKPVIAAIEKEWPAGIVKRAALAANGRPVTVFVLGLEVGESDA